MSIAMSEPDFSQLPTKADIRGRLMEVLTSNGLYEGQYTPDEIVDAALDMAEFEWSPWISKVTDWMADQVESIARERDLAESRASELERQLQQYEDVPEAPILRIVPDA